MKQARHIFAKDLRRLRWLVIAWLVLIGARTYIETAGADIALAGFGPQVAVGEISAVLSVMSVALLACLVSRLVHDEPLVGRDAFWITRPIAPGALMAEKLVFAAVFLVFVPVVQDVLVAAAFGTRPGQIAGAIPPAALNHLLPVAVLMCLAAVTPSLTGFLLAILGVAAALVTLMMSAMLMALLMTEEVAEGRDVPLPDPTPVVIAGVMIILVALATTVYQYRTRRLGRALAIAAAGILLVFAVPARWPRSLTARPRAEAAPPIQDSSAIAVSLDGSRPRIFDGFSLRRGTPPRKQVAAHVRVSGVPSELTARAVPTRSRLELPNGVALQTAANAARLTAYTVASGAPQGRGPALEASLGARLITRSVETDAMSAEQWPVVLTVDEHDFLRHRNEPGRLTVDLDLMLERAAVRGRLPLADGFTQEIGPYRASIVRVIRRATGCTVLLRLSHVETLFALPRYSTLTYVLHNPARREAAAADVQPLSHDTFSAGVFMVSMPRFGGRGFVLDQSAIDVPARTLADGSAADLDEAWIRDAELVVLEMVPAGVINRTVSAEPFRMTP